MKTSLGELQNWDGPLELFKAGARRMSLFPVNQTLYVGFPRKGM